MHTNLTNIYSNAYKKMLDAYYNSKSGHMGGGISCLPALITLFHTCFDAKNDKLVFSKGHNALALYTTLNAFKFLSDTEYETFYKNGTRLGGHPPVNLTDFTPFATGSLGHGPSLAVGLALAKKIKQEQGVIYCLCGDGEWQEGSCWEAISFAQKHLLNNLTFLIDCNNWQGYSRCADVIGSGSKKLIKRIQSFEPNTYECDGHNLDTIADTLTQTINNKDNFSFIFLNTIKGYGLLSLEDTIDSHYKTLSEELYSELIRKDNI